MSVREREREPFDYILQCGQTITPDGKKKNNRAFALVLYILHIICINTM